MTLSEAEARGAEVLWRHFRFRRKPEETQPAEEEGGRKRPRPLAAPRAPRPMSGGRWRRPGEMVQPGGSGGAGPGSGSGTEGGAAGEEAAVTAVTAAGRVPLELGGPEGLQRLLVENRELKAALRRSSDALRGRCEELRRLQTWRRTEREVLRGRAGQARALVERLRAERDEAARRLRRDPPASEEAPAEPPESPPRPRRDAESPRRDPATPRDPSPTEQLRQRLAAAEAELVTSRAARAAAEERAEAAGRQAELQLQALRRQLEDKASVKAQVTSLLGELQESQSRLESSRRERDELEQRAAAAAARCRALEEAAGGQELQLDQLRLQVQNLEGALRVERQGATEEKRKLVQLQVAYHHLFQEYDAHIKASLEGDKRSQELEEARTQLQQAEEALAAKQELIDKLKGDAERHRATLETIPVLQAQADIYKADFEAERAAREQLHAQREALQEALAQLRLRLDTEGTARVRLEEMRNRHSELRPPVASAGFGAPLRAPPAEEQPDLCCPKCQYKAPDMDTLQIHVMDCIK
ncbi:NF-kappa-B essential modulator isoform X3 [Grus americana]|uniref:NF-kappa-B essential modulator isoform X3 n=1 Tax=Grus americana TaxID=9117 RepID=UPI002407DCFC|nr:NF-kappa-B essential modulator isoform X3 [Grus americana]